MTTYVYVLKSVASDMIAYGGFKWPFKGKVVCEDFKPTGQCGNGLHGFLWGEGDGCLARWENDAVWLVIKVKESDVINLGDKVKFPEGEVVFSGEKFEAITFLKNKLPPGKQVTIIGDMVTAGKHGTANAGDYGTAIVGDYGTATARWKGTATAGDNGTANAGYKGTATAGNRGTATAGDFGTATAGDFGTATAGIRGTATAGYRGIAAVGVYGTATAGRLGEIRIRYYDIKSDRYKTKVGYIGEGGLKANVAYRIDRNNELVRTLIV